MPRSNGSPEFGDGDAATTIDESCDTADTEAGRLCVIPETAVIWALDKLEMVANVRTTGRQENGMLSIEYTFSLLVK